jgi:hypothetical protein
MERVFREVGKNDVAERFKGLDWKTEEDAFMDGYHKREKGGEFVTYARLRTMGTNGFQEPAGGIEGGGATAQGTTTGRTPGMVAWSYDFVEDRTHNGRRFRMLSIIDEFTHECLAIRGERKLKAIDVSTCSQTYSSSEASRATSARTTDPSSTRSFGWSSSTT